jgi:hypothetical protein
MHPAPTPKWRRAEIFFALTLFTSAALQWHQIGTEHVEHQQVELAWRSVNQGKPGIAQNEFHLGAGIGQAVQFGNI